MISRLVQVKVLADGMGWDYLLPSEWQFTARGQLPLAEHTKMLWSDTMSLSLVVPALLDLTSHFYEFDLYE